MNRNRNKICPVERAGGLDTKLRTWLQNPFMILKPYIKEGMTVLDVGCGPGFFSMAMADMVGSSGRVIAVDIQEGMLDIVRNKIKNTKYEKIIRLHKCEKDKIGYTAEVDFILVFYVIHELPDNEAFFKEIYPILKLNKQIMIVEPKLFHVSKRAFKKIISDAEKNGFQITNHPKVKLSRSVVLKKIDVDQTAQFAAIFNNI